STVIARQVEREYTRAAEHVEQLIRNVALERHSLEAAPNRRNRRDYSRRPSAERERAVGERIRELIEQRLERAEVPDSVRDFLLNVWLRHLRTAALRNGEDSTEFRVAMEVVDDLVWSLDGIGVGDRRELDERDDRRNRRELAQRIPPLIRLMTQGVREIGAQDDEYRPFFDELFLIHLRRMQRRNRAERRRERGSGSGSGGGGGGGSGAGGDGRARAAGNAGDDAGAGGGAGGGASEGRGSFAGRQPDRRTVATSAASAPPATAAGVPPASAAG
ncbi:MAG TPA: DUF1631 family protein, partial [Burkholderiaceae bacterium]|nr:DUF1631 family protein [Burkholderiaceae bacterium]